MPEPAWRLTDVVVPGRERPRLTATADIPAGLTAVLGPSGAGKSTLADLLVGFLRPARGRVERVLPATARPAWAPAGGGLWPHLSVRAHLATVAADAAAVEDALDACELRALADARPDRLSAGERDRLAVARALASGAGALVLDEPFAHLAAADAARLWAGVLARLRARGATAVYTTHAPERVVGHADHVLCLDAGAVLWAGAVDECYHRPATAAQAALLGPANWLEPGDAAAWLDTPTAGCVRPERLRVEPAADGPCMVRAARFHGALAEVEVERGGQRRAFWHRPAQPLAVGARVTLRLAALVAACCLAGCGTAAGGGALVFAAATPWSLPLDGASQPAPRALGRGLGDEVLALDTAGRVLVYAPGGALRRQWRMPAWDVGRPEGVVLLPDRRIAVADTHYHRVVFFDQQGVVLGTLGRRGRGPGQFEFPVGVCCDAAGDLYVSEYGGNDRVQRFAPDGSVRAVIGRFGTGDADLQRPQGLCWDDGRLYIADAMNDRVQVFSDTGAHVGVLGAPAPPGLRSPYGIALGPDRTLTVVEFSGDRITRLTRDGRLVGRYGRAGRGPGEFATPWAVTVGGDGRVWVADTGNRRVVELAP